MLKIAVCDDEVKFSLQIENLIIKHAMAIGEKIVTEVFPSGEKLCESILMGAYYDIIFIDIEMSNINGIEAGKWIRNSGNDTTLLIYVSSHEKYHSKLFDVQPYNFVKKPIDEEELLRKLDLAVKKTSRNSDAFEFTINRIKLKLRYREIIYFEVKNRIIVVRTKDKTYEFYGALKDVINKMSLTNFVLIHRSFYINLDFVQEMSYSFLILENGENLVISEAYRKTVKDEYMHYLRRLQSEH